MWLQVLHVCLSIHLNFVSVCAKDILPAFEQLKKISAEQRPCLLNSASFEENEGGYWSLLEDCNPFDRFEGHPPKFLESYRGVAPIVSLTTLFTIVIQAASITFMLNISIMVQICVYDEE